LVFDKLDQKLNETAKVQFSLDRSGNISHLILLKCSSDSVFDQQALEAIKTTSMQALPPGSPASLDIQFTFDTTTPVYLYRFFDQRQEELGAEMSMNPSDYVSFSNSAEPAFALEDTAAPWQEQEKQKVLQVCECILHRTAGLLAGATCAGRLDWCECGS